MNTMLETQEISKSFSAPPGWLARLHGRTNPTVYAVNQLSLRVEQGEVLGLVGESGCGKSTVGRMIAGLLPPTSGAMLFEGRDISRPSVAQHRQIQMVFQNPYASLNPRLRIEQLVGEAALYHGLVAPADAADYVRSLLSQVGLDASYATRYPQQFSGGQRQRIAIARALALKPRFIVCDEAVSALDVSVQAQILNLFMDLREAQGLTYLFISHNLAVVEYVADRVAIMYLGQLVELADTAEIFSHANHPYTRALIADAPRLDAPVVEHQPIQGELPSPLQRPGGCAFHPRCPHAMPRCAVEAPAWEEIAPRHWSACHLNQDGA
ncbi:MULTISPECIES: ABC transporter ATP-binding protein [unclassified Duganella]|uniref:ABC transporter ATP-binding protein n=1 Tax=unclassified Duganella TaxID=2636909 RepID=UPI00088EECEA|nr:MULTISPECIES: ABC transporter ATP-binding protein [unclassified Duganella]SDH28905.1 peptide/nickel transport system ATP-binding protein [Duganella sp. OV458]SDK38102.1 peptide/nickel transport system ATP-binding protein [Duganella sp. OV510]